MEQYSLGDRVVCTMEFQGKEEIVGCCGTVVAISPASARYAIEFDLNINGHTCSGYADDGHGWWIPGSHLMLQDETNGTISRQEEFEEITYEELMG